MLKLSSFPFYLAGVSLSTVGFHHHSCPALRGGLGGEQRLLPVCFWIFLGMANGVLRLGLELGYGRTLALCPPGAGGAGREAGDLEDDYVLVSRKKLGGGKRVAKAVKDATVERLGNAPPYQLPRQWEQGRWGAKKGGKGSYKGSASGQHGTGEAYEPIITLGRMSEF